jgi:hypothetical protein
MIVTRGSAIQTEAKVQDLTMALHANLDRDLGLPATAT